MHSAYEVHKRLDKGSRSPADRCLNAIDLTASAPECEITKTVNCNSSRAVCVPRVPQQVHEKVQAAPQGQPQACKPGNLFSMWKQQKQDPTGTCTEHTQGLVFFPVVLVVDPSSYPDHGHSSSFCASLPQKHRKQQSAGVMKRVLCKVKEKQFLALCW